MTAAVKLEKHELCCIVLRIPDAKCNKICCESTTAAQKREGLIYHFLNYSEYASWSDLASKLYYREHHEALSAARRFIDRAPGKRVFPNKFM